MRIARNARIVGFGALLCFPPVASVSAGSLAPAKPVALVYSLAGEVALTAPAEARRPLRLFDRLATGSTLEVSPGARLALAFAKGRRYELGERSWAKLGPADLVSHSGPVRSLPAVPPFPRLLPIAKEEQPGLSAGAVRIRYTAPEEGRRPPRLLDGLTLAAGPVARLALAFVTGRYELSVRPRAPRRPADLSSRSGPVRSLPIAEVEQPGLSADATGRADFVTLPPEQAKEREALRKAVETAGEGALLALLADVDRSLGLLIEARDELRVVVRGAPGDADLAEALAEVERRLEEEGLRAEPTS